MGFSGAIYSAVLLWANIKSADWATGADMNLPSVCFLSLPHYWDEKTSDCRPLALFDIVKRRCSIEDTVKKQRVGSSLLFLIFHSRCSLVCSLVLYCRGKCSVCTHTAKRQGKIGSKINTSAAQVSAVTSALQDIHLAHPFYACSYNVFRLASNVAPAH